MMATVIIDDQAPLEVLQLIAFAAGVVGSILLPITVHHSEWRMWKIEKNEYYLGGFTQVGIWKICFPSNSKGSDTYLLNCCHEFDFFEKFFPIEMKLGQILMSIGSLLAFGGLLFAFLIPLNNFFQKHIQISGLHLIGGILFLISSICVFISISWNVYSVFRNEIITFPSAFNLPPKPVLQKNGGAVYIGYLSGFLLFVSGISILYQVGLAKKVSIFFRSTRVSHV